MTWRVICLYGAWRGGESKGANNMRHTDLSSSASSSNGMLGFDLAAEITSWPD